MFIPADYSVKAAYGFLFEFDAQGGAVLQCRDQIVIFDLLPTSNFH